MEEIITMAHGSGGRKTSELIENLLLPVLSNEELNRLNDGALLNAEGSKIVFSSDSFVIKPLFFPGGNIGKLAVCGTVNDISVCGGVPKYLSLSLIIEEGFRMQDLKTIIESLKAVADSCGVQIVTGDTKVVEKGNCDGLYINTSGIGFIDRNIKLGAEMIKPGDKVIVSGTMGDHGLAVLCAREKLFAESPLKSDCAPLAGLINMLHEYIEGIRVMRDPTRGGLATTLKEFVESSGYSIKIFSDLIPVRDEVRGACEILGIDPLYAANEGKMVLIAAPEFAESIVYVLKSHPLGKNAAIIGEVTCEMKGRLLLDTGFGSTRIIDKLYGDQLPRIC
jgi:hydrogenase expression/formation protein HypE